MKTELNVFTRFPSVWKQNFFQDVLMKEKSTAPTWKFWFFWNFIFTLIASLILAIMANPALDTIKGEIYEKYPDAEIRIIGGELSTS